MPAGLNEENDALKRKINAFSILLRLGHEAFEKKDIHELATHIVNNTRAAFPFQRSSLIDMHGSSPEIKAQSCQMSVNHNSEYNRELVRFADLVKGGISGTVKATGEFMKQFAPNAEDLLNTIKTDRESVLYIVDLPHPSDKERKGVILWFIEFAQEQQGSVEPLITLLSRHYAEAVWSMDSHEKKTLGRIIAGKASGKRLWLYGGIILLASMFIVRLDQRIAADFTLVPRNSNPVYAKCDGIIAKCHYEDGNNVKKDDLVISLNTEQLQYRLASTRADYNRATAEQEKVSLESFTDKQLLSKVKLLKIRQEQAKVAIDECEWLLRQSYINSPADGILLLSENSAEKMEGKAVKTGDKLFEVFAPDDLIAEIEVDEQNASLLGQLKNTVLYLHSSPEQPIRAHVFFTGSQSMLTERKTFCYILRADLLDDSPNRRCGMRGTARISGPKVSLGYYLFRSIMLWWRRI